MKKLKATDIIGETFYDLCRLVDSPVSLGCWIRFCDAHVELAEASVDPLAYNNSHAFMLDYACVSLLKKYRGLYTGVDLAERALVGLQQAERKNELTNSRLLDQANYWTASSLELRHDLRSKVIDKARNIISKVWGTPTIQDVLDGCDWGPGATASLKGAVASAEHKSVELPVQVTPTARPILQLYMSTDYTWLKCYIDGSMLCGPACLSLDSFSDVSSGRIVTVPKSAKTDRVVMAEPTGNVFLQKGVGRYLRRRLKSVVHVDLNDQTRNQVLAQKAVSLGLATLDLKDASNSITIGVVKLLCSPRMFSFLNRLRTPAYQLPGAKETQRFHLFSSMGNGFTFELESLIFYALTRAVAETLQEPCDGTIGIYGDDIICHGRLVPLLTTVLSELGFSLNFEKSFVTGRFRESCGKHFFDSIDVTPVYQKDVIESELSAARFHERMMTLYDQLELFGVDCRKVRHRLTARCIQVFPILSEVKNGSGVSVDGAITAPHTHRFCTTRGFLVKYLKPVSHQNRVGDKGLFSTQIRRAHNSGSVKEPTMGRLQMRQGKVHRIKVGKRWVSLAETYGYRRESVSPRLARWLRAARLTDVPGR